MDLEAYNFNHLCHSLNLFTNYCYNGYNHRVDRLQSYFSVRPNWDSLTPSPAGECVPPPLVGGGGGFTLACGRGYGWSQF
jgi:hypothetical protein